MDSEGSITRWLGPLQEGDGRLRAVGTSRRQDGDYRDLVIMLKE
jgi:hypothetical protein